MAPERINVLIIICAKFNNNWLQNNFNLLNDGRHQGASFNMCSLCKNYHYSLRNSPEERSSRGVSYFSTTDSVTPNLARSIMSNNVTPNLQIDQDSFLMF